MRYVGTPVMWRSVAVPRVLRRELKIAGHIIRAMRESYSDARKAISSRSFHQLGSTTPAVATCRARSLERREI